MLFLELTDHFSTLLHEAGYLAIPLLRKGQQFFLEILLHVPVLFFLPPFHITHLLAVDLLLQFLSIDLAVLSQHVFALLGVLLHLLPDFLQLPLQLLDFRGLVDDCFGDLAHVKMIMEEMGRLI